MTINHHYHHDNKAEIPRQFVVALETGALDDICQWLNKGVDLNHTYRVTQTPLLSAISKGRLDIVNVLLEKGADPNMPNIQGQTPLFSAVSDGRMDIVQALLAKGANPSHKTRQGNTPLYIAAVESHYQMVSRFLDVEEAQLGPDHPFIHILQCLDMEIRSLINTSNEDTTTQAEIKRHEKIEFLIEFRDIFKLPTTGRQQIIHAAGALERKYDTRIFQEKSRVHRLFVVIMRRVTLGKKSELAEPVVV